MYKFHSISSVSKQKYRHEALEKGRKIRIQMNNKESNSAYVKTRYGGKRSEDFLFRFYVSAHDSSTLSSRKMRKNTKQGTDETNLIVQRCWYKLFTGEQKQYG